MRNNMNFCAVHTLTYFLWYVDVTCKILSVYDECKLKKVNLVTEVHKFHRLNSPW